MMLKLFMNKADVMPNSLKYGLVLRYSKLDTVEYI